jgi:hypothetical protein
MQKRAELIHYFLINIDLPIPAHGSLERVEAHFRLNEPIEALSGIYEGRSKTLNKIAIIGYESETKGLPEFQIFGIDEDAVLNFKVKLPVGEHRTIFDLVRSMGYAPITCALLGS